MKQRSARSGDTTRGALSCLNKYAGVILGAAGGFIRYQAFFMSETTGRVLSTAALLLMSAAFAFPAAEDSAGGPRGPLLDLNTATAAQLERLPGIGKTRAEMIVRMRRRNGPFQQLEELRSLPRLTSKQFERLRLYLTVVPSQERETKSRPQSSTPR